MLINRYSKEWEKTVKRIGRWIDFENDYKTLDPNFMESVWWVFSTLFKKGLVYQGFKVSQQMLHTKCCLPQCARHLCMLISSTTASLMCMSSNMIAQRWTSSAANCSSSTADTPKSSSFSACACCIARALLTLLHKTQHCMSQPCSHI